MNLRIFQINIDRDKKAVAFESFDKLQNLQGTKTVDSSIYDLTYEADVNAKELEDIYRTFNIEKPSDFCGRSLSVSDVVEINESDCIKPGFYYCDSIGFREIEFDASKAFCHDENSIKVVMCEPGKKAYITEIKHCLSHLQAAVGGDVEAFYPFKSEECIICNEEGKFNGMLPCRAVYDNNGTLMDVIFGKFFICGCGGEEFSSLSDKKAEEYLKKFELPERIFREGGKIVAVKYQP